MTDAIKADLAKAQRQEEILHFAAFDEGTAWTIGSTIRERAASRGQSVSIDIRKGDDCLFFSAMPGTAPTNADWARRKRNLVNLLHTSSFVVGLKQALGENILERTGLALRDYAPHGGCFPVRVTGSGVVGTITVSGLPQREDHKLVVEVVSEFLGVDLGASAL
ncbi:MAG: heme-degrading domain-containing protein [Micrococcales bacterium]